MTDHHAEIAKTLTETFKASLDEAVREQISEARLHELTIAIHTALSSEQLELAEYLEEVVKKLRAGIERPQIEL
jgi:L-lactate utilization protein LutC